MASWQVRGLSEDHIRYEIEEHSEPAGPMKALLGGRRLERGLEVGVGPWGLGFLAVHLADKICAIDGLDPLPRLEPPVRDEVLRMQVQEIRSRVHYVRGHAERIPARTHTYDIVSCINVVDHAQEPAKILAEIDRVLKPGGVLVFGVNTLSTLGRLKWMILRALKPAEWLYVAHPHTFSWRQAAQLLQHVNRGYQCYWTNRPTAWQRTGGHGRMSFWLVHKPASAQANTQPSQRE